MIGGSTLHNFLLCICTRSCTHVVDFGVEERFFPFLLYSTLNVEAKKVHSQAFKGL